SPSSTWAPLQIRTASLESQTIPMIQDVLGQILRPQFESAAPTPTEKTKGAACKRPLGLEK
ncbi:hypothetical protein ABIB82_003742, partial [Bradyrhizobium sp. i1.8.4]|uniref:hypothetical protein n=1 Tax=Bradyrhizobium sp. i1.8.4 TaxID=3156364 RepID=UPI003D1B8B55